MAIDISCRLPVKAQNAGLFISRGVGTHPTRVIQSHEILFVDFGSLSLWEDDIHFNIKQGEALLLVPGHIHGGAAAYPPDLRFYWIHFDLSGPCDNSDGSADIPHTQIHLPKHAPVARADRLTELFRMFLDDQETGGLLQWKADLLLCLILTEVASPYPVVSNDNLPSATIADRARQYIKTHVHEELCTSKISEAIGLNPDYLERIYKKTFNLTITQAIHHFRIKYSRRLILDGIHNIYQIAYQCGYSDPNYFRRIFKRHVGMTPKAFQKLHARAHVNTG